MAGPIQWIHTFFDALTYDIPKRDYSKLRKKNVENARDELESLLALVPGASEKDVRKLNDVLYLCEQGNWSKLRPEYIEEARHEYNRIIRSLQPNADAPRYQERDDYGRRQERDDYGRRQERDDYGHHGNPNRESYSRDYDQRRNYQNQNDYGARDFPPSKGGPYRDEGYGSRDGNRQGSRLGNRLLVTPQRPERNSHRSDDRENYIQGENKLPGLLLNSDVSDSEKTNTIAKMFVDLYDYEWNEALEVLIHTMKEQKAIEVLKEILIGSQSHVPVHVKDLFLSRKIPRDVKDQGYKSAKEYRRAAAAISIPVIQYEVGQKLQSIAQSDSFRVNNYINRCISVLWLMVIQDPPLSLYWPQGNSFDSQNFYEYTDKGNYVDFSVWPALRLYEGGPLLSKGVVKCR
ncbi:hypothetical protein KUTeg_024885 [Tegillarca granosa]|uniref:Mitochondria-eating protein C-terminal domain-containing protein n=1 Tax=Tegillarca granosa TaxID=220873 RepID=A0ABQ9DYI7_TEGGR|nr:hypothetical protein KUTeg_024885 [Tegillarca granosa]